MPYYSELGIYMSPTASYSTSYIPGPYSNHSSLLPSNFTRPPSALVKPRSFRGFKPHLATITESQSALRRVNSPKLIIHSSPKVTVAKPIKINTADIDVSVNKYRKYDRIKPVEEKSDRRKSPSPVERKSPSPSNNAESPRESVELKEAKPSKIRRDRHTVRIQTIHKDLVPQEISKNIYKSWRDNIELQELFNKKQEKKSKNEKKSPGELLKEKFLIRSREDLTKPPEKKIGRRTSKKSTVQKTPSFHDICTAITSEQINEGLNPGQPLEIQRRQSRQISTEEIIKELKRNSADLNKEIDTIINQRNNEISEAVPEKNQENYDSRTSVKKKKKLTKKKSNEKLTLPQHVDPDSNKSGLQRRPTQKKIKRTSTDSSISSDIVDPDVEKAYQEAIRDISQVEIEEIKHKPKPIVTATVNVEEKPALKAVVDDVEIVESPKPKKTNKFKFNVIVEEIEEAKRKKFAKPKSQQQNGTVHVAKPKEPIISNILKKNQKGYLGHVLEDIQEATPKPVESTKIEKSAQNTLVEQDKTSSIEKIITPKQSSEAKPVTDKEKTTLKKTSSIEIVLGSEKKTPEETKIENKVAEVSKPQDKIEEGKSSGQIVESTKKVNEIFPPQRQVSEEKKNAVVRKATSLEEVKPKEDSKQVADAQKSASKDATFTKKLIEDEKSLVKSKSAEAVSKTTNDIPKTSSTDKLVSIQPDVKMIKEKDNKDIKLEKQIGVKPEVLNVQKKTEEVKHEPKTLEVKIQSKKVEEVKSEPKKIEEVKADKMVDKKQEKPLQKQTSLNKVDNLAQNKSEALTENKIEVATKKIDETKKDPLSPTIETNKNTLVKTDVTAKKPDSPKDKKPVFNKFAELKKSVPKKPTKLDRQISDGVVKTPEKDDSDGENFWAAIGPRESIYIAPRKILRPQPPSPSVQQQAWFNQNSPQIPETNLEEKPFKLEPPPSSRTKTEEEVNKLDSPMKPTPKFEDKLKLEPPPSPKIKSEEKASKLDSPTKPQPKLEERLKLEPPPSPKIKSEEKVNKLDSPTKPQPKFEERLKLEPPPSPKIKPEEKANKLDSPTKPQPKLEERLKLEPPPSPKTKSDEKVNKLDSPTKPEPKLEDRLKLEPSEEDVKEKKQESSRPKPKPEEAATEKEKRPKPEDKEIKQKAPQTEPEEIPKKAMPSKRSLVNKATKDDPDLVVFVPPEPEPEPEPAPEPETTFVPLQSNRLSQFMNPFKKPEQYDECPVEIYATPKTIRKRHYPRPRHAPPTVQESESSEEEEEESEEETSSSDETSSDDEYDVNVVYGNNKVGASTSSNDSGFDSGVPGSRNKDCDLNCHKKCEKLTANLCGVNQKLMVDAIESVRKGSSETRDSPTSNPATNPALALDSSECLEEYSQSSTYASFQKSGRITPPATTIPRFRKYCVEDFNFLKVLGKGSFGKVLLAELKSTEYYYAIKCLKKDVVLEDDDVECTLIERKVLALATKHPYLCHLLCTFQTESHLFFVMEYLNGGDLMFHIQQSGRFPEARARFYAAEIVSGLKFLHNKGIVYRDLKLDNILLDFDGHVRIADFGMCKLQIFLDRMADTFCGTPDYMAPEIIKGQHYNQSVDWWSFGVLLYEMLIGQSPFSGCDEDELFWSICNEKPVIPRFLTAEASEILLLFLEKDGNKRLGNRFCPKGDIQDQAFFKPIDWNRLEARMLEAPFKPNLQHPLDTQYFDRTFTVEKAKLTPIEQNILQSMDQTQFQGFSYTNPNATDK